MSKYPRTGIDKAILKFGLQGGKISQIVSAIVTLFSGFLISNNCHKYCLFPNKQAERAHLLTASSKRLETPSPSLPSTISGKKIWRLFLRQFFSVFIFFRK
ncbi:hypothetical protein [Paraburkholderia saeva]|uniref:hypothetical protein n=1 Tax=Paraburkholderia saeva TaxID=2777537 RepID=UPI001E6252DF|nr:hypothetical protein [Paraburkholderia saeva]